MGSGAARFILNNKKHTKNKYKQNITKKNMTAKQMQLEFGLIHVCVYTMGISDIFMLYIYTTTSMFPKH